MGFMRNIFLVLFGCVLIQVFLHHFSGIPEIQWNLTAVQKEQIAREVQYYYLLLVVPAVFLIVLGLNRAGLLIRSINQLTSFIVNMPRKYFMVTLFVLAFSASAWVSSHYLHRSPQIIDSHNYYFQARIFTLGRLWVPSEPYMEKFFNFPAIMDTDGRRYGSSFPGHPFFLAVGEYFSLPWLVNPLQGGLIVVMIYLLAATIFSEQVGRLAGILVLFSPFRLLQCALFMAHPTATLWILVFLYILFHYFKDRMASRAILLGIVSAVLYLTRPQSAVPVLLPFGVYYIWSLVRGKVPFRHIVVLVLPVVVAITAGFLYNRGLTGEFFISPRDIASPSLRLGFGPDVGRPLPDGTFSGHSLSNGLAYTRDNFLLLIRETIGWGGWTVIFALFAVGAGRSERTIRLLLLLSGCCLMALFAAYPINSALFGPSYYFEWMPLYLILVAVGMCDFKNLLSDRIPGNSEFGTNVAPLCTLFVLLSISLSLVLFLPSQIQRYCHEIYPNSMKQAVEDARIEHGLIFFRGNYFTGAYAFVMNDPLLKNRVIFANDRGDEENRQLLPIFPGYPLYRFQDAPKGKIPAPPHPYNPQMKQTDADHK